MTNHSVDWKKVRQPATLPKNIICIIYIPSFSVFLFTSLLVKSLQLALNPCVYVDCRLFVRLVQFVKTIIQWQLYENSETEKSCNLNTTYIYTHEHSNGHRPCRTDAVKCTVNQTHSTSQFTHFTQNTVQIYCQIKPVCVLSIKHIIALER